MALLTHCYGYSATLTVLISHLVDCSNFYVQCADSTINEIMEELAAIYEVIAHICEETCDIY